MTYSNKQIAHDLERTALNDGFFGQALYAARDIPSVTREEKAVLIRYSVGMARDTDHIALQQLAIKIRNLEVTA